MRYIFFTRGIPGSGKSTFLKEKKLEPYTLSSDEIRLQYQAPILNIEGDLTISQESDRFVWETLNNHLESKMRFGELIFVDATHTKARDFQKYKNLIDNYKYRAFCLDFSDVKLDICKVRNRGREDFKVVPEEVLEKMWSNLQNEKVPSFVQSIKPEEIDNILSLPPLDFSKYNKIHHFGDIQGCLKPLEEYFDQNPIQDDELYIFVGDYCDRGHENGLVMKYILQNYQRPNFILLEGNHEEHLWKWACGQKTRSDEFEFKTKPQLEEANIQTKDVRLFYRKLRNLAYYTYGLKTVLVTHGGISSLPENLIYIKSNQFIRGVGLYEQSWLVDDAFERNTPPNTFQIHGHRNIDNLPTQVNSKCFNLEGKVEFGGHLRVVTLDKEDGFKVVEIANPSTVTESNVGIDIEPLESNKVFLTELRNDNNIIEKQFQNNISSFNFSKKVFYSKEWSTQRIKARGLFINSKTYEIIIRSYDKFFNINEIPETGLEAIKNNFQYPVKVYLKENGYLGLVGFNSEFDELVFASKSSPNTEFAAWLKDQFLDKKIDLVEIKKELISLNACLLFEVVEPKLDPHIVSYIQPELVLLDIVLRQSIFEKLSDESLAEFALRFGFKVKQKVTELSSTAEFETWYNEVSKLDYRYKNEMIEGFVLEDKVGFKTKIKTNEYSFWKSMRAQLEAKNQGHKTKIPSNCKQPELARKFLNWLESVDRSLLTKDIITLRKKFEIEVVD